MGKPTGFKEYPRQKVPYRDPLERLQDFREIFTEADELNSNSKALGAWTAACHSANPTPAVPSIT